MTERYNDSEVNRVKNLFVQTKAYRQILETLESKRYVVIKGNTGDGKTTLAHYAISEMRKKGKKPLEIYKYEEWDELGSVGNNLVVFIDNIFGEFSPSGVDVTQWSNRFKSMKALAAESTNWNCFIIALRTDILEQICLNRDSKDFLEGGMVDINVGGTYHLTDNEKEKIYNRYLPNHGNILKDLPSLATIGFPQCCQMAASFIKEDPKYEKQIPFLFADPKFVRDYVKKCTIKGGPAIAVLVYVLFKGGNVKRSDLNDTNLDKDLKREAMDIFLVKHDFRTFAHAISSYKGTFVIHDEQADTYIFSHSSVMINLFLAVGEIDPLKLLQNCSYDCLSMVTTEDCNREDVTRLSISGNYHSDLANRIRRTLRKPPVESQKMRTISELSVWKDENFVDYYLENDNCSLELRDENGWSVLVHFAIAGNLKWVRYLCENRIKENGGSSLSQGEIDEINAANGNGIATVAADTEGTPSQIQLALTHACSAHSNEIVEYLISKGATPDITSCFYAVKAGNLDIINILVQHGADLTQTRRTLSKWDTVTTVLDEAGIYKHEHLMIPLLTLCPRLKDIPSSINASAIHFAAASGNIKVLEYLIDDDQFNAYDQSGIGSTILHFASQNNQFHAVKHIVKNYEFLFEDQYYCYEQGTVLHTAAQSGNVKLFQYLFEENKKYLNKCGQDCVTLSRGCYGLVQGGKCAKIHKDYLLNVEDESGISLLHRAADTDNTELFKFIFDNRMKDITDTDLLNSLLNSSISNEMKDFISEQISP